MTGRALPTGQTHVAALTRALAELDTDRVERWARHLAHVLPTGARLLAAGNGGSAAEAQHLVGELVGRYRDDRDAYGAIALCADTSILTAVTNDYGAAEMFARQVRAHGRPGDVLVALSTSGRSTNVLAAVTAARHLGLTTWALTGAGPNPLGSRCDDALYVASDATATVQEVHLVAIHVLCAAFDVEVGTAAPAERLEGATP